MSDKKFLIFMYFIAPFLVGVFMYFTLEKSVIRELNIGILDLDSTATSRDLIFEIKNSSALHLKRQFLDLIDAQDSMKTKEIYALVVIPKNFESNLKKETQNEIKVYYNAQFVSIAKNIQSALTQIFTTNNIKVRFANNLKTAQNADLALLNSISFKPNILALYNESSDFARFLLTSALPCLWQLFITLGMINILFVDKIKRVSVIEVLFGAKNHQNSESSEKRSAWRLAKNIIAKISINSAIFLAWWLVMSAFFMNLNYQDSINFSIQIINALVLILAYSAVGVFIVALVPSQTKAVSVAAIYATPSLAFIGITFPLSAMRDFAGFWSTILPITRYIQAYFAQNYYYLENLEILKIIAPNAVFLIFGILGILIFIGTSRE